MTLTPRGNLRFRFQHTRADRSPIFRLLRVWELITLLLAALAFPALVFDFEFGRALFVLIGLLGGMLLLRFVITFADQAKNFVELDDNSLVMVTYLIFWSVKWRVPYASIERVNSVEHGGGLGTWRMLGFKREHIDVHLRKTSRSLRVFPWQRLLHLWLIDSDFFVSELTARLKTVRAYSAR